MRDRSLSARTIAVEQSVEMPLEAIDAPFVNSEIVGRVLDIKDPGTKDLRHQRLGRLPVRRTHGSLTRYTPSLSGDLDSMRGQIAAATLERHEHTHNVLILRGYGHCLVGHEVREVATHDLIAVPPTTWHQFRATADEPLGFLCMVNTARDKPQLPTPEELAEFEQEPGIADFLNGTR